MLGSLIIFLKGMRRMMFQLSGFYCRGSFKGIYGKVHEGLGELRRLDLAFRVY